MDQLPLSRQTLPVLLQSPRPRGAAHTPHTCVQVSKLAHHLLTELNILIKSPEMNGKHDQYANKVLLPQFPCTQKNYTKLFIIISIMVMIIMATEIYFSLRHAGDGLSHMSHLVSSPRRSI